MVSKIEENRFGLTIKVSPFDDSGFTYVTGSADHEDFLTSRRGSRVGVSWPSIGRVTSAEARQFAAAIIEACDWVELQENKNGR